MTRQEREALEQANDEAMEWFRNLSPEARTRHLIKIGILSPDGRLSGRYGGPGEWTEPPDPRFKWIPDDDPATTPPRDKAAS